MCGIAGVVGDARGQRVVPAMCAAIRHRGPDADGFFHEGDCHLGMRRLAIIDVAHGDQPFSGEGGRVVTVFNGEIYNHNDLRRQLRDRGHSIATTSDTEVLPHLYEEYGAGFVDHLQGMFAIAVWDRAERTLVLARDRAGKKPLFYAEHDGALWFGSELGSLLAAGVLSTEIDPVALDLYLTYQYVPHPWTIFRSIRSLPPGHTLTWRDGRVRLNRYWSLRYPPADAAPPPDEAELAEQLREHLLRATRARMLSERPLGAFLSGGLDSSAVVAAMTMAATERVKTFSIGFGAEEYNELPHARQVARLYDTDHHELVVEPDIRDVLPRVAAAFGQPFADASAVPSWYVAQMAREHVVVALNGDGGDESFGGYGRYPHHLRLPDRRVPPRFARLLRRTAGTVERRGSGRVARRGARLMALAADGAGPASYARMMSYFETEQRRRLYTGELRAQLAGWDSDQLIEAAWAEAGDTDRVNRLLAVDVATYLPGDLLPKVDITTMAHSLEARSPLLDTELMQWAAALPGSLKVRGTTTKYLMKKALEPWLPAPLIHRTKQGFGIPREQWLAGPLREMTHDLLTDGVMPGWFDAGEVRALLAPEVPDASQGRRIWSLLMLRLWLDEVHQPPRRPAPSTHRSDRATATANASSGDLP